MAACFSVLDFFPADSDGRWPEPAFSPDLLDAMRNKILWTGLLLLSVGCGNAAVEQMSAEPQAPWEALETFQGEPLMSVGYPRDRGDWGAVKSALTSPMFEQSLAQFEMSPLPDAYSDKQAKKDAIVTTWKDAIAAAKGGKQDELKAKVEAAIAATSDAKN
jgi:hypothetical protein